MRGPNGKINGWHVTEEPEWDDEQIALLLALRTELDDVGPHGQPMSEATDPRGDVMRRGEGWHYEGFYRLDHAQKAMEVAQQRLAKQYGDDADTAGFVWGVRRVEDE